MAPSTTSRIRFELGAIALLEHQCERIGIRRPLIVTDRGVKGLAR
jgi:alcohol dehydrogenase class IV